MASSKKLAAIISSIAFFIYFSVIIFQVPLFRVPCRSGICTTPIEVTCSQLIATELCPAFVIKALLYPGTIAKAIIKKKTIPSYDKLFKLYNFTNLKKAPAAVDLQSLEVLAGSYLSVAGAFLGLVTPGRMSLFGVLLILWGLIRDIILTKPGNMAKAIHIYPTMLVSVSCAFLSIRKDLRKIIHSCKSKRVTKAVRLKAKYT